VESTFDIQIHYYLVLNMEWICDSVEYHGNWNWKRRYW